MLRRRTAATGVASLALLALVLVLGARSDAATAPQPPGLSAVNPGSNGYFEATLSPGGRQDFTVSVSNLGNAPATYRIYAADGTTAPVTGVAYSDAKSPPTGAGSWITLSVPNVSLQPNRAQQVGFVVSVPSVVLPGDHVGAIASDSPTASHATGNSSNGGSPVSLSVTSRVVIAVVVHIPGSTRISLQVGRPSFAEQSGGRQVLLIPLNDNGDLLFKPHLSGTVTPCSSASPVLQIDRQLDTFVPRTAIVYPYQITFTRLPQGCYTLDLHTDYPGGPLGSFHGDVQLGPLAAGTATTLNLGGGGERGLSKHRAGSIGLIAPGFAAALLFGVLLLLILFFLRRRKEEEEEEAPGESR